MSCDYWMSNSEETVSTTVRAGPPKYQATIPHDVREILGTEGKEAIYQIDVKVKKVVSDEEDD